VAISDTTPEAKAVQEKILRNMTGERRLLLAWEMSLFARELARAGHPAGPSGLDRGGGVAGTAEADLSPCTPASRAC